MYGADGHSALFILLTAQSAVCFAPMTGFGGAADPPGMALEAKVEP